MAGRKRNPPLAGADLDLVKAVVDCDCCRIRSRIRAGGDPSRRITGRALLTAFGERGSLPEDDSFSLAELALWSDRRRFRARPV